MKKIVITAILMVGMGSSLMADIKTGVFSFDMGKSVKENEVSQSLLENMSKNTSLIIINKDKTVTLVGENRKGKEMKKSFPYTKSSKNTYKITAGRGIELKSNGDTQLKAGFKLQNDNVLFLYYSLKEEKSTKDL